jgi:hypothetical protein
MSIRSDLATVLFCGPPAPGPKSQFYFIAVGALAYLVSAPAIHAQIVSGRLLDDETDAPISGAELFLLDGDDRVAGRIMSGDDGTFLLLAGKNGWYKLQARRLGYATTTSAPLDLVQFDSLDVEFRIAPEAIPLAPITVIGQQRRPEPRDPRLERWDYYERKEIYGERMGFGHFLEGDDLRPTAFSITDMLQQVNGLRHVSGGGRKVTVFGRSGRRCRLFIDGVYVRDGLGQGWVSPTSVVAIEVYPGMVAPGFYDGRGCVVGVWTGIRPLRK